MLTTTVLATIARHDMLPPGAHVLVGLSGGPDSVALTHVLHELAETLGIRITVAHMNHGLRLEADADEAFCRELALSLALPFRAARADVAAEALASKRSLEDQARRSRYTFFSKLARELSCDHVAVGHTLDDQAETVFMRLTRGSAATGLASIRPVAEHGGTRRVRPLFDVRRRDVLDYLAVKGLLYRIDPSNLDRRFTRNRVRHDVLPRLAKELNPRLIETLVRNAEILRDEDDYLDQEARRLFENAASTGGGAVELAIEVLRAVHPALKRRLVRLAVTQAAGSTENLTARHVQDVLALSEGDRSGRETHLPGLDVERTFQRLRFSARTPDPNEKSYNVWEYRLTIPGQLPIRETRGLLTAHLVESVRAGDEPGAAAGNAVDVGVEDGLSELAIRSPRPSDRFRPLGAPGAKPLRRYLMERKVAKGERRHVPLVVRADADEILWVVGHSVSETARLGAGRRRFHLEWKSQ